MPYTPTSKFRELLRLDDIPDATPSTAGCLSAADKTKLDTIPSGGGSGPWDAQGKFDVNTSGPSLGPFTLATYTPNAGSLWFAMQVNLTLYDIPNIPAFPVRSSITIFNFAKLTGLWTLVETDPVFVGTSAVINSLQAAESGGNIILTVTPGIAQPYSWRGYYTVVSRP